MCFAWHADVVFTCMTKAHSSRGALLHKLVPGQVSSVSFLQATVYCKMKPQPGILGKITPRSDFSARSAQRGWVLRFSPARDSPAKTKNLLPSVDIWVLFRWLTQPLYRQDSYGKTSLVPRQPIPFFSISPSKVASTVSSVFILCCYMLILRGAFQHQAPLVAGRELRLRWGAASSSLLNGLRSVSLKSPSGQQAFTSKAVLQVSVGHPQPLLVGPAG